VIVFAVPAVATSAIPAVVVLATVAVVVFAMAAVAVPAIPDVVVLATAAVGLHVQPVALVVARAVAAPTAKGSWELILKTPRLMGMPAESIR